MTEQLAKWLKTKPANRDELALWAKIFLGFKVLATSRCVPRDETEAAEWAKDGKHLHQSQLDYLESSFFNQHSACVYMATRNGGKSQTAGVCCILDCLFKPAIKIAIAPYTRDQAEYIKKYIESLLAYLEKKIGQKVANVVANQITFPNGSIIRFFSGGKSDANVTGFRPNVLIVDEADKFSQPQFDGIANCLEGGGTIPSRLDILSTNYTLAGDGVILNQIEKYEQFNKSKPEHMLPKRVFRCCLLDIAENCDHRYLCQAEDGTKCSLWPYCKGVLKKKQTDGYYHIDEAISKTLDNSRPSFEAQYLLMRPTSEFAIFGGFSIATHVLDPEVEFDPLRQSFLIWDFGGSVCPHAALLVQRDKPAGINVPTTYYVLDEFEGGGVLEDLIARVKARYPQACRDATVFADTNAKKKHNVIGAASYLASSAEFVGELGLGQLSKLMI